jgi:polyhydroxyalkanoate synthesis regulator phasin
MEALAMDKLVEKGDLSPQVARAVAEALDITIQAANLATVPMLDVGFAQQEARFAQQDAKIEARFGQLDTKMEARFGSIEKLIERTKVWATLLYAGLAAIFFGGLAVDHRWLVNREDQLMAQMQARNDARFAEEDLRTDRLFTEEHARSDRLVAELQANAKQAEVRMDAKLDQLRALIINGSLKGR